MHLRLALAPISVLTGPLVLLVAAAAGAADVAEVELIDWAISRVGAEAAFGYSPSSPDLVSEVDTEEPLPGLHDGHEDAEFYRALTYQDAERVNTSRSRGGTGTARGEIEAGHSIAVTSGWADAGSNGVGGFAEANAGTQGGSMGVGSSSMRIEKRITIQPGESGLAPGTLVTGLVWELRGQGFLEVSGRTHPADGTSGASCDLDVTVLRGPTGTCGAFDCPHGALAVQAGLSTGLSFQSADPATHGGRTGYVLRNRSWSASTNAGQYKAGGVFTSGSDNEEVGLPLTDEDSWVRRVEGVDTAGPPLGLDAIEFEANVGEVLRVTMDLDIQGSVNGTGAGIAELFDSFDGGVVDPLARGLVFESSVPVPEPLGTEAVGIGALVLVGTVRRRVWRPATAAGRSRARERRPCPAPPGGALVDPRATPGCVDRAAARCDGGA